MPSDMPRRTFRRVGGMLACRLDAEAQPRGRDPDLQRSPMVRDASAPYQVNFTFITSGSILR